MVNKNLPINLKIEYIYIYLLLQIDFFIKDSFKKKYFKSNLLNVGVAGLEPAHHDIKNRCLTSLAILLLIFYL